MTAVLKVKGLPRMPKSSKPNCPWLLKGQLDFSKSFVSNLVSSHNVEPPIIEHRVLNILPPNFLQTTVSVTRICGFQTL